MFKRIFKAFVVARTASALYKLSYLQLNDIAPARHEIPKYAESVNA